MPAYILTVIVIIAWAGILYAGLILLFTSGWYRKTTESRETKGAPGHSVPVSVVIAARNEASRIGQLLADLSVQDYGGPGYEVIVVDDHSTDGTAGVVNDFAASHPGFRLRLIENRDGVPAGGKKYALAAGIAAAPGDIILTTDADCRVGPAWVASMTGYFDNPGIGLVAGPVSYLKGKGLLARFQSLEYLGMMASGAGAARLGMPFLCSGANLAYRRSVFTESGGFSEGRRFVSGDDIFLMHAVKRLKGPKSVGFAMDPGAIVLTRPADGWQRFMAQRARWASKSTGYRDTVAVTTALSVFLISLGQVAAFLLAFMHPMMLLVFAGSVLYKSLIDLPLLLGVTALTGTRSLMNGYPLFQAIYPFYIVTAAAWSFFRKNKW